MTEALATFNRGLAGNPYVRILARGGGRIALTPLEKQEEPAGLVALKSEIGRRWPMTRAGQRDRVRDGSRMAETACGFG
jgi:hypothetical protein